LGRGEPWLILDAEGRLAKALSTLWIVGIFAGPCLLAVLSMRVASLEIRSDGSVSYLVSDVLSYLMLLALAASAGVLSLRVIANVTQLRRKQREVKILGDDYE
jgi:TRAP-type C4-dicarboxylate transport system permease small subunit